MKIGDRVYVHGFVDEIRKDCVIIRNDGGYFGTVKSEIVEAQKTEDIVSVIRCKDCKFFELNHFDIVSNVPIITAHEICTRWGDEYNEYKTSIDGYCFLAERKEDDNS